MFRIERSRAPGLCMMEIPSNRSASHAAFADSVHSLST